MANSIPKYLMLDKIGNTFRILRQNGGIVRSLYKAFIQDALKWGTMVGEDKYGNKYFENNYYFYGRSRWMEYSPNYYLDYDGSQIPAEWHGWMHHRTDLLPSQDCSRPKHCWMADHTENYTGTCGQFTPYSTTRPKIQPWLPPCGCNK